MTRMTCQTCGAEIEADRPSGLCPACLLNEGLTETLRDAAGLRCTKCQSRAAVLRLITYETTPTSNDTANTARPVCVVLPRPRKLGCAGNANRRGND